MLTQETYLPSFYASRWTQAAILFADIKNFTPLTQILRNVYAPPGQRDTDALMEILNKHCSEMARIIQQKGQGRINRFFGPGVMAIFGEHERNPTKAAGSAAYVAIEMIERFQTLRREFLETAFGGNYETEYNESVDVQLAIGIDYGTVLFDYLGDSFHREFTVLGDHVTYAEQLQYYALQADENGRQHPSILISPTVERCIRPFLAKRERVFGHREASALAAFGLSREIFDTAEFLRCQEKNSWDSVWTAKGLSPPPQRAFA
jgi:class 3 adenylate cyclase